MRVLGIIAVAVLLFAGAVAYALHRPGVPHGYCGLEFAGLTPAAAARTPLLAKGGALVLVVDADSPAARAGIRPGQVVARIDGTVVTSARQASDLVKAHHAGDRMALTLFDITEGEVKPHTLVLTFAAAPETPNKFSVRPPRTLAKEFFYPPGMAANAAWSRRLARGAFIRPRALAGIGDGHCNGFTPEDQVWDVRGHAGDDSMFHIAAHQGFQHALYQSGALNGADPKAHIAALLEKEFGAAPQLTRAPDQPYGFTLLDFGNLRGAAGFVLYRVTAGRIALWAAGMPGADIAWARPLVGAVALSLHCHAPGAPPPMPRPAALQATSVSQACIDGACREGDFAGAYMSTLKLGYVHGLDGMNYLVNPRRDLWQSGAEGPGFYHQIGGENEKLEPGRTN
jgi:hypothetical protein